MLTKRKCLFKSKELIRFYSCSQQKSKILYDRPDPHLVKYDYIGPPDKTSNLRPYVRCIPENETPLAKSLRIKRISVEQWNQSFWSRHNKRFYDEKQDFIKAHNLAGIQDISADKMSVFYKSFLDKNKNVEVQKIFKTLKAK